MWLCAEGTFARELGLGGVLCLSSHPGGGLCCGDKPPASAMASVATEAAGNTEGVVFFTSKHFGGKAL